MIISPCISICKMDPKTGYCYGCARNNEEKINWKDDKISNEWKEKNLTRNIEFLIKNSMIRNKLQKLSIKNFYLTHEFVSKNIDDYRSEKLYFNKKIFLKSYDSRKFLS